MTLWTDWLDLIGRSLDMLTASGLGSGLAIVVLTLAVRLLLLPVSWSSAYRGCLHQKRLRKLQPELKRLKEQFGEKPAVLAEKTLELYRKRGLALFEGRAFLGSIVQLPVLLGMFHVLRSAESAVRFLWVSNLARPDFWFAVLAGATTALMMAANPELPEQARLLMIVVPALLAFVFALQFASALSLYWVTSNLFSALHTAAVHCVLDRQIKARRVVI